MTTKKQQPMVDTEKARINAMANMNYDQRMALIEDITNEKAAALLAQSLSNPAFNGMNTLSFSLSEIATAIRYHADAVRSTSPADKESQFDLEYRAARNNLVVTAMEQNLLTVDLPVDAVLHDAWDLWVGWKSNRVAGMIEPEAEVKSEAIVESKQEVIKPKRRYVQKQAEPEVIVPVIPEPEEIRIAPDRRIRWNIERVFSRIDAFINEGGNILKPMEFKRFENGGYQWAIIHLFKKEKGAKTPKGAAWQAVIDAYLKAK